MTSFVWAHIIPIQSRRRDALFKSPPTFGPKRRLHLAKLTSGWIGLGCGPRRVSVPRLDRPVNHGGRRAKQLGDLASAGAADAGGANRFRDIETLPKTGQLWAKTRGQ